MRYGGLRVNSTAATLSERFQAVTERIGAALRRAGREGERVILVAVTKHAEPEQIRELIAAGHRDFGENKVQQLSQRAAAAGEWLERMNTLRPDGQPPLEPVRWHMIGRLQRNKVRRAIEDARLIHTVDSLRVAEEIQTQALKRDRIVDVLIQVNCSLEPQKGGVAIPAAIPLAEQIETMVNVRLRGLMTMAAISDDPQDARPSFARLREVYDDLRRCGAGGDAVSILSMGMSDDFEVAIEEGANLVRIGSAIFGQRAHDDADDADDED